MTVMNTIKRAATEYPVLDLIRNRWSPRSFSEKNISEQDMNTILEAATWSFSALNEQPWRFLVAHRGTDRFNNLLETLYPGNKPWNKQAAALVLTFRKKTMGKDGHLNPNALHDVGAANMLLSLQANSMGIYTHLMEGFEKEAAAEMVISSIEELEPVVLIALGYPADASRLEEPYKSRELAPRKRKTLEEVIIQ